MAKSYKISGLRELDKNLEQFTKSTQRRVLERVLKQTAKPVEDAAKRLAPVDKGDLKRSIETVILKSNAGKAAFANAMQSGATRQEAGQAARAANKAAAGQGLSATVRVRANAPHAIFAEFGTQKMPAQPFMGPAFRSVKTVETMRNLLRVEIDKTAKRMANRASRGKKS